MPEDSGQEGDTQGHVTDARKARHPLVFGPVFCPLASVSWYPGLRPGSPPGGGSYKNPGCPTAGGPRQARTLEGSGMQEVLGLPASQPKSLASPFRPLRGRATGKVTVLFAQAGANGPAAGHRPSAGVAPGRGLLQESRVPHRRWAAPGTDAGRLGDARGFRPPSFPAFQLSSGSYWEALGWDDVDARQSFGLYDTIVLLDFGLTPIDDMALLEFFEFVQVPIEVVPASLDRFREAVRDLLALPPPADEPGAPPQPATPER